MKILRTQLLQVTVGLVSIGLVVRPGSLRAQPTAHYVPGVEGIKGASLPPPGFYLRDYNVFYYANQLNDAQGHEMNGPIFNPKAFIYANVPRFLWITDTQVLGGFLGVDALLPIQYTDLEFHSSSPPYNTITRYSDSTLGIGDFFVEGTWSKHIHHFDFSLAAGIWAPTGDSAPQPTTRAGAGYWTGMLTAGATWYPDAEKKWAISALNRYEFNSEKADTDITPGQAYTLEWGVSRALSQTVDLGVIGYYQQQVTEDSGTGSTSARDLMAGVGPEVNVFYPHSMLGWSLRYAYEFMAEDRLQGHTVALTITKRF